MAFECRERLFTTVCQQIIMLSQLAKIYHSSVVRCKRMNPLRACASDKRGLNLNVHYNLSDITLNINSL